MYKYFEFITEHKYKGDMHDLKEQKTEYSPSTKK